MVLSLGFVYLAFPVSEARLDASEPKKNLGELKQGVTVPVEFELMNHHAELVEIVDTIKSCACATIELPKAPVSPGERVKLKVMWSTGAARGLFTSEITVVYKRAGHTNYQSTNLRVEAQVIPDIECEPPRLVFTSGEKGKKFLTFSAMGDPKTKVVRAYSTHRAFTAILVSGSSKVEVAFDPSQWPEDNPVIELIVETTSTNQALIKIPIMVEQTSECTSGGTKG